MYIIDRKPAIFVRLGELELLAVDTAKILDRSSRNTVEILIMHSAGSPTSLCIMRCYALSDLTLSVQGHFVPGRSHAL